MRTTVDIPDELYQEAELKAAREGVPVGHVITEALRRDLVQTPRLGRRRIAFPLHRSAAPGTLSVEVVRAAEQRAAEQEDALRARAL